MPVLRPSGSDFTAVVKAAAQYVVPGRTAKTSRSGSGMMLGPPSIGALARASRVGALSSPTTSAVNINGVTQRPTGGSAAAPAFPVGLVTAFIGSGGQTFLTSGTGTTSDFTSPSGMVLNAAGTLMYAVMANSAVARINIATGNWTVIAGQETYGTSTDGTGAAAAFTGLGGIALSADETTLYMVDGPNFRSIVISTGVVTTLNSGGTGTWGSTGFQDIARLPNGNFIVSNTTSTIYEITPAGVATVLLASAVPGGINGICINSAGTLIGIASDRKIYSMTYPGLAVTFLAGQGFGAPINGTGSAARFRNLYQVKFLPNGDILAAESTTSKLVRRITPGGVVTTAANLALLAVNVYGLAVSSSTVYVSDYSGTIFTVT